MITQTEYLNRLRDGVIERFGVGSDEVNEINDICDYWEKNPQPKPVWTNADYRAELSGLRNEMRRHQGFQPWDERFKLKKSTGGSEVE